MMINYLIFSGIFKFDGPYDIYIDLHGVEELYQYKVRQHMKSL